MENKLLKQIVDKVGTPVFVYDESVLKRNIERIFISAKKYGLEKRIKLYISYFTNSNPNLFKLIKNSNIGILLQTEEEYFQLKSFKLIDNKTMVSPSYLSDKQIDFWVSKNIPINLASIEEIKYIISKYPNFPVNFRIDATFWQNQRIGIKKNKFEELKNILINQKVKPHSFHIYCGTGSSLSKHKGYIAKDIKIYKKYFSDVKEINLGGGFGFDYDEYDAEKKHFDWDGYFSYLYNVIHQNNIPSNVTFLLEPGREIFVDSGDFIIKIKRIIQQRKNKIVATNGSYIYIPSAKLKERQHSHDFYDENFNKIKDKDTFRSYINGSSTLSSDYVLPFKTNIPLSIKEGDYIIIHDAGAYASTEKLEFLNKKPCAEVLIKNDNAYLITKRGKETDKIRYMLKTPELL